MKHLNKLKLMDYHINYNIDYLKEQLYTFEEINTLFSIETHIKKHFSSDEMKKWVPDNQILNTFSEESK